MNKNKIISYSAKGAGFACLAFASVVLPIGIIASIGNFVTGAEQLTNGVLESDLTSYKINSVAALGIGVITAGLGTASMLFKPK